MARLPLFPLGTVLVPGGRLPLRVFEPRYVALLETLLHPADGDATPEFGVVAIRAGHEVGPANARDLYAVGCTAVLERVDTMGDGTYVVRCRGERRFRLDRLVPDAGTPYLTGEVSWLADGDRDPSAEREIATIVRRRLQAYRALAGADQHPAGGRHRLGDEPSDASRLSYLVGGLVPLPLADRQRLLEASTTPERLRFAADLLRREELLVSTLHAYPAPTHLEAACPN